MAESPRPARAGPMAPTQAGRLLTVSALVEIGAGTALLAAPSLTAKALLGAGLDSPESALVAQVAGSALLSIGLICGMERNASRTGLVIGMLTYNVAIAGLLVHAALFKGLGGVALWPACVLHLGLAIWCVMALGSVRGGTP